MVGVYIPMWVKGGGYGLGRGLGCCLEVWCEGEGWKVTWGCGLSGMSPCTMCGMETNDGAIEYVACACIYLCNLA